MKKSIALIVLFSLAGCSSSNTPINIGNDKLSEITDCEQLLVDKQKTENEIENLKTQIHRQNVADGLNQVAAILAGGFNFTIGESENDRNKKRLEAYTERQTILNQQISLHCK